MKSDGNDRQILYFWISFDQFLVLSFFFLIPRPEIIKQIIAIAARHRQLMINRSKSLLRPRKSAKSLPIISSRCIETHGRKETTNDQPM